MSICDLMTGSWKTACEGLGETIETAYNTISEFVGDLDETAIDALLGAASIYVGMSLEDKRVEAQKILDQQKLEASQGKDVTGPLGTFTVDEVTGDYTMTPSESTQRMLTQQGEQYDYAGEELLDIRQNKERMVAKDYNMSQRMLQPGRDREDAKRKNFQKASGMLSGSGGFEKDRAVQQQRDLQNMGLFQDATAGIASNTSSLLKQQGDLMTNMQNTMKGLSDYSNISAGNVSSATQTANALGVNIDTGDYTAASSTIDFLSNYSNTNKDKDKEPTPPEGVVEGMDEHDAWLATL